MFGSGFDNIDKDSTICYFLVFIADFAYSEIAMLSKADAITTCNMFSNGTLPYDRNHVHTLNAENITRASEVFTGDETGGAQFAPIKAWFGATLDHKRREYISDISGKVIKTDDQLSEAKFWLVMFVGGLSEGSIFVNRESNIEQNIS